MTITHTKRHSTRDSRALCDSIVAQRPHNTTTGALSGRPDASGYWGQLPSEYRDSLRGALYVVRSYETPIAWLTHDGRWVIPDVRYSSTTSCHQGVARSAASRAIALGVGRLSDDIEWLSACVSAHRDTLAAPSLGDWDSERPWAHGGIGGAR